MVKIKMQKFIVVFFSVLFSNQLFCQLVLNVSVTNTTCQSKGGHNLDGNNIGTGRINITATGGIQPYTYGISGNHTYTRTQNNGYFPQLYLGNYTLTVIDSVGLRKDTLISISSDFPIPVFAKPVLLNPSTCESTNGKIVFPTPTSGKSPFLYSIDGGASFNPDSIFTNLREGFYMCKVLDGNGCMSFYWPISLYDTMPCAISANQLAVKTACGNDAEAMRVRFHNKFDSIIAYSFDSIHFTTLKDKYLFSSSGYNRVDSFINLSPGIHNLYLKDTVHNIRNTSIINIAKSCELYIQFLSIDASCGGGDGGLTINASGGIAPYTYTIDGINYQTNNSITGLKSGTYTVTVKDASGALSSAIASVYNKCPVISFTKYNDTCGANGGGIIASAIKGVTPYMYSVDNVNYQFDNTFKNLLSGFYKVYVRDANNFKDSSAKIKIIPTCIVNAKTVTNELCNNQNATVSFNTNGGTKPYFVQVINTSGIAKIKSYDSTVTIYSLTAGKYNIRVIDMNGITIYDSIEILNTIPTINLGNDTTLCEGTAIELVANLLGASLTWQDNSKNNSYLVTKAGKYWVTAKLSSCQISDTINVSYLLFNNPVFPSKDTVICVDSSIVLNANYTGATYLWNDNSTTQTKIVSNPGKYWVNVKVNGCAKSDTINCRFITGPTLVLPKDTSFCIGSKLLLDPGNRATSFLWSTNETTQTIKITQPGKYWLNAKALGCTTIDTLQVIGYPIPSISLGNDTTLCVDSTLILDITKPMANYVWQDGSKNPQYRINHSGKYWVTVTQNGCDTTAKISINYLAKPIINLGPDTILCVNDQLVLYAGNPETKYLWQNGSTLPIFTVKQAGRYYVVATNLCGQASDTTVIQYKNCACEFNIPNAFSPNGDGINDEFKPQYSCTTSYYSLTIFDRYGMPLFQTGNQGDPWNGTRNGKSVPTGTYYYILKVQAITDSTLSIKSGSITIIR